MQQQQQQQHPQVMVIDSERGVRGRASQAEEMLDLVYDPVLNCYFDGKSGKYFQLA
jgi:hypothetical protein